MLFKLLLVLFIFFLSILSYSLKSLQDDIQLDEEKNEEPSSLTSDEFDPLEFERRIPKGFGGLRYILY